MIKDFCKLNQVVATIAVAMPNRMLVVKQISKASALQYVDIDLMILFYSILFYSILFYSILFYSIPIRKEDQKKKEQKMKRGSKTVHTDMEWITRFIYSFTPELC